ncbi:MAG: hypothetical protein Q7V19_10405 [Bacteroidales bacterium]|nr:hypothetical protein [Bacteroidales bacterium]
MSYRYKKLIPLGLVLLILGGLFFLPLKIPFSFQSMGLLNPAEKWIIRTDLDGNFYSELKNFNSGVIVQSTSYRFERGDIASLYFSKDITNNASINKGDTIGILSSRLVEDRIQKLESQMVVWNQQLQSQKSGEKEAVVEELRQKLVFAQQQFELTKKNFDRSQILFLDSLIAREKFESAETEFLTAKTNIEIAQSSYNAVISGAKPEAIRLVEEQILASEKELHFLKETKQKYVLLSPMSGKLVLNQYLPKEIEYMSIIDTTAFILYAPVKFHYRPYLSYELKVDLTIPGTDQTVQAEIFDFTEHVEIISSNQVIFVKARISDPPAALIPGLSVKCKFAGEPVTLREYVKRTLDIFLR